LKEKRSNQICNRWWIL